MYYATKRNNNQTRLIGAATVILVNVGAAVAIMNGFGSTFFKPPVESEVVMIEEPEVVEDEPPPPPPIDVDLPPPPPQVILPDFVFDTPPPQENAIREVVAVAKPQAPVAAKPPPAPVAVSVRSLPKSGKRFERPEYPAASKRAGEQGEVTVSVCVDASGRMSDVKLIKSSGFPRLDEATVKGMSKTRVEPAIGTDGKPMVYCNPPHTITIVWNLEDEKKR